MDLLNYVVIGFWSHDVEVRSGFLSWGFHVSDLIEMIMAHLTKINDSILLDLDARIHVYFYSRSVHNAKITNIVPAILADYHEL